MKVEAREVKIGNIIKDNSVLYKVLNSTHVKPGKGGAYCQIEAYGVFVDKKLEKRYRVEETIERVMIYEKPIICIENRHNEGYFISITDGEDMSISKEIIEYPQFLQEDMECVLLFDDNETRLGVKLPKDITCTVLSTNKGISSSGDKDATLDNDYTVKVPSYVENGEKVIISLHSGVPKFKSRA